MAVVLEGARQKDWVYVLLQPEAILNGVHGGHMAGRTCWVVAGTYCDGGVQGIFAKKYINCKLCNFYQKVLEDEGKDFEITINLMKRLQDDDSE